MWRVVIQNHVWSMQIWDGDDPRVAAQLAREANRMFRVKDCEVAVQVQCGTNADNEPTWVDIRELAHVSVAMVTSG